MPGTRGVWRAARALGLLLAVGVAGAAVWAWLQLPRGDVGPGAYRWEKGIDDAEVDRIAGELVARMSLGQKLSEISGVGITPPLVTQLLRGDAAALWRSGGDRRLGIPPLRFTDGPRGVSVGRSTAFPVALARAASWDVDLETRVGDAIGIEVRAHGGNAFGGVCVDLVRHPSMGRAQETYGEDPWLTGEMAVAMIQAVQRHNVMAVVKHFALNSMETGRYRVDVRIEERALREVYLPQFRRCVEAGVASVMSAYNRVRGEYCGHNRYLLTTVLREDWGFRGFVMSDFIHGLRDTLKGVRAGLDMEMPGDDYYGDALRSLVEAGTVPEADVDAAVRRVVRTKLRFVTREDPATYPESVVASPEHVALAREAAEQSTVLLKNEGPLLPLDPAAVSSIAVIGVLADADNTGDRASSLVDPPYVVTPLQGIRERVGPQTRVLHPDASDPAAVAAAAAGADVAVVIAGFRHDEEGEYINLDGESPGSPREKAPVRIQTPFGTIEYSGGDRVPLSLRKRDLSAIAAAVGANPRTAVVLIGGSAITMEEWREDVPAILMAWYPGMEGGSALARILFGDVSPSAKLPLTFPRDESQLPPFDEFAESADFGYYHGYALLDRSGQVPAFAFGHGLSYTSFSYARLEVKTPRLGPDATLRVSVEVRNTGARGGAEIVQLYVGLEASAVDRPRKVLRAFDKVALAPGERASVELAVAVPELAWYDPDSHSWRVDAGSYPVWVGGSSSESDLLTASFEVTGGD
jgi:beta-glucosidase